MKNEIIKRKAIVVLLAVVVSLLAGCQVIALGVFTAAGAVGLTGYAVYKTGDVVVTGAGKAVEATGDMLSSGTKSATTVVYSGGVFKTEHTQDVPTLWNASGQALQKARFVNPKGTYDALSGTVTAKTVDGTEILITLKSLTPQSTEMCIRVGLKGDLQKAEVVHGFILRELSESSAPVPASVEEKVK
jgi:hypothetical protein